ncbi:MAG: transposase, partial [Alphaproteobacteria bacterium]|nr:transposase [Alphaproteobacteria bacterium]
MTYKHRVHTAEFKLLAVRRMIRGCNVKALAEELGVRRQLLYKWKAAFEAGGPDNLLPKRRGRRGKGAEPPPGQPVSEVAQLRARIAELERLAGRQAMELDFFAEALRVVGAPSPRNERPGATASTPSSGRG